MQLPKCQITYMYLGGFCNLNEGFFYKRVQSQTRLHVHVMYVCMYFHLQSLSFSVTSVMWIYITLPDLPTSKFLSYLVRFLKGNTAVRFFLQKYVFQFFFFFFFFSFSPWRVKVLHYTHYLWKLGQSFWIIAPEST